MSVTWESTTSHIKADVIILGCSLPGIVTAHKLKKKFGNTVDIVVLDLTGSVASGSKCNVTFQEEEGENEDFVHKGTAKELIDNVGRHFIAVYAKEFNIPVPDAIITPEKGKTALNKLFEYKTGDTVDCKQDFHDFDYLNIFENFELNQYQTLLDQYMRELFQANNIENVSERHQLMYFDQTTMEQHICNALIFANSKDIMRNIVRVVCGAPASVVSLLFYLHQCYRTSSARNHLDGNNTKLREKLLGYCRKRIASKLQKSVANITMPAKPIKKISTYSDEQVILRTFKGDTNYVCSLLAMAMKPDELRHIEVESQLLYNSEVEITAAMKQGKAKKFLIQYEDCFWQRYGYSGDILSVRGPIIWAMERPTMSATGSLEKYAALIGYLTLKENDDEDSREAVIKQLVRLFGADAASPVSYRETDIADIYVPRCGDFIGLRRLTRKFQPGYLEWGALDIFGDGDVAAALEAGHTAYLHLMSCLRPQALTYEEISAVEWPTILSEGPLRKWLAQFTIKSSLRLAAYTAATYVVLRLLRSYIRK
ncbi:probable flavin-containing monoamine oxidase A [Pararge aegeria]|uniref:monoamine oxidase n=1 Tax=Pararge aegeria aegeria TaxID=348720 RepID=A0A8S4QZ45_9NEOP|nr:probable flavin-containing monoamine oxidase A [Pararge aegeria]CAH2227838.1 jg13769 [Pararge aegeria aegeria]